MIKTKKKSIYSPLVIVGYILFALLVITTIISTTIPFGTILSHPQSLKVNVTIAMLALTIGAVLPVLVGYIVGDRSIKSKNIMSHHFNGVLFGLLAYWTMTLITGFIPVSSEVFPDHNTRMILVNIVPSIGVAIVTLLLAISHLRSKEASHDIIEYKPFVAALVIGAAATPIASLIRDIVTNHVGFYSFLSLGFVALIGIISYRSLRGTRLNRQNKLAWSAVSVSVLYVTTYVSFLLTSTINGYVLPHPTPESLIASNFITPAIALVGWLAYWLKQKQAIRSDRK